MYTFVDQINYVINHSNYRLKHTHPAPVRHRRYTDEYVDNCLMLVLSDQCEPVSEYPNDADFMPPVGAILPEQLSGST